MEVHNAHGSLYVPELDLWLDPHFPKARAFVSHAHSDHFARHEWTLCTPETDRLIASRYGEMPPEKAALVAYGQSVEDRGHILKLVPAGHIHGSAMLHITRKSDGATLLYTGDFKLRPGLTCEPAEFLQADTLIMETTFGLPKFVFPPRVKVIADMVAFVKETLEDGGIPVLLGYSLGKAQEILAALKEAGVPVMLHDSVAKMTEGCTLPDGTFPEYVPFRADGARGHALVFPPNGVKSTAIRKLKVCRTAMFSGWALLPGAKFRYQVDEVFPMSDHADYPELLQAVELTSPRRVLTVHGYTREFARDLRERGYEAWSLVGQDQLELSLAGSSAATSSALASSPTSEMPADVLQEDGPAALGNAAPETFAAWVQACERVLAESSRLKKRDALAAYLSNVPASDLARAVRWFFTTLDDPAEQAAPLQIGWAVIRRTLLEVSGLPEQEYRAISQSQADLGRTAYLVLQRAALTGRISPREAPFTVAEMGVILQQLRDARGPAAKAALLKETLTLLPPLEGSYLVRLLSGELRIGSREGLVEDAVATAFQSDPTEVREAAMLCGDLGRAALLAELGKLDSAQPTLFVPIKVMLASPEETAADILARLSPEGKPEAVWLEDKFDGIRAQLHASPGRVEMFSRDLKTVTAQFPEIAQAALALQEDVIFDGEIIAYAEHKKLTFQDLQHRLGRKAQGDLFIPSDISVHYVVFDLLWHKGRGLLREPLSARRTLLETVALPSLIRRIAVSRVTSVEDIEAAFLASRRADHEGLLAKDANSFYTPGRRGKTWLKLKKAFATLDCVVVKAEQGHGKRSHVLSDYTFAVRDEESGELRVIGKAYSGLTDVEIEELTEHFTERTLSKRGHVRTVIPDIVLEIAFDSIQPSTRHNSGLSLRFPRIKAIRRDKTPEEIDTLAYAQRLAGVGVELGPGADVTHQMPSDLPSTSEAE